MQTRGDSSFNLAVWLRCVYPPVIALGRTFFRYLGLRFDLQGTENVPASGGAVMAINHVGYLDFTFAGLAALPSKRLFGSWPRTRFSGTGCPDR